MVFLPKKNKISYLLKLEIIIMGFRFPVYPLYLHKKLWDFKTKSQMNFLSLNVLRSFLTYIQPHIFAFFLKKKFLFIRTEKKNVQ